MSKILYYIIPVVIYAERSLSWDGILQITYLVFHFFPLFSCFGLGSAEERGKTHNNGTHQIFAANCFEWLVLLSCLSFFLLCNIVIVIDGTEAFNSNGLAFFFIISNEFTLERKKNRVLIRKNKKVWVTFTSSTNNVKFLELKIVLIL